MYPNRTCRTQGTGFPSQNQFYQRAAPTYSGYHHVQHYQQPTPYNRSGLTVNPDRDSYNFIFGNPGTYNVTMNIQNGHANGEVRRNEGIRFPCPSYLQATQNSSLNSVGNNHFNRNLDGRPIGTMPTGQFPTVCPPNQVSHRRSTGYQQQRTSLVSSPSSSGSSGYSRDEDNESGLGDEFSDYFPPFLTMLMRDA